jgi:hypothetical protein
MDSLTLEVLHGLKEAHDLDLQSVAFPRLHTIKTI